MATWRNSLKVDSINNERPCLTLALCLRQRFRSPFHGAEAEDILGAAILSQWTLTGLQREDMDVAAAKAETREVKGVSEHAIFFLFGAGRSARKGCVQVQNYRETREETAMATSQHSATQAVLSHGVALQADALLSICCPEKNNLWHPSAASASTLLDTPLGLDSLVWATQNFWNALMGSARLGLEQMQKRV